MLIIPSIPTDVQLWDNRDGTWRVNPESNRAFHIFKDSYGQVPFNIEERELLKVVLLCMTYGLVVYPTRDILLTTMTDLDGKKITDPKQGQAKG